MINRSHIPTFHNWILRRFCKEELYNELAGDLEESFYNNMDKYGLSKARKLYKQEVVLLMRPSAIRIYTAPKTQLMLLNNIKMAFRHMRRDKQHTAIALFGLSIGLMASFLIFQYVHFESNFESIHHSDDSDIYRVSRINQDMETGEIYRQNSDNFLALKDGIVNEVPDVVSATQVSLMTFNGGFGDQIHESQNAYFTDAAFFDVFNFRLISGSVEVLDQPNHILLSASFAKTIFGDQNPIGQTITYYFDDIRNGLTVGGVFEDAPSNTHIRPEVLVSMDRVIQDALTAQWFGDLTYDQFKWRWTNFHTYVKVPANTNSLQLKKQIDQVIQHHRGDRDLQAGRSNSVVLHNLRDLHFVEGYRNQIGPIANVQMLRILQLSGALILLLAWINYINLTSARSIRRSKETGVRKVLGAMRVQLIHQFLVETIVFNLMAAVLATVWCVLLASTFHEITGLDLLEEITLPSTLPFLSIIIVGILISGLYPSMVLSRFKPVQILRGRFSSSKHGIAIRSVLMFIQFTVVLILLSGVFVIQSQLNYMTNYDIGMQTASVVTLSSPPGFMRDSSFHSQFETMSQRIAQIPAVQDISSATLVSGENNWGGQSAAIQNDSDVGTVFMFFNTIDEEFVSFHHLEIVAGRDFSKTMSSDQNGALVNEMVAKGYGMAPDELIGKTLLFQGGVAPRKVIGVIKNFYPMGVKYAVEPMVFSLAGSDERYYLNLKLAGSNRLETLQQLEEVYHDFFPGTPFRLEFAEQRLQEIFASDRRVELLLKFFSSVAMIIAGLGIVGLTTFLINQKMKEVSIRKVLGASFADITSRFSKEYVLLMIGAAIVGIPTSAILASSWLDNYQMRIALNPLHFVYPMIILLTVIASIICTKTFKAATTNPSEILRSE